MSLMSTKVSHDPLKIPAGPTHGKDVVDLMNDMLATRFTATAPAKLKAQATPFVEKAVELAQGISEARRDTVLSTIEAELRHEFLACRKAVDELKVMQADGTVPAVEPWPPVADWSSTLAENGKRIIAALRGHGGPVDEGAVRFPRVLVSVSEERRATAREATVRRIATSMQRRMRDGKPPLLQAIRIRPTGELVTGLHRLLAHEQLDLDDIAATLSDGDAVELELDEIEENLARKDLTILERAVQEKRQKQLYLQRYPETAQGVAGGRARHGQQAKHASFAAERAAETKKSRRLVEQRIQIAERLTEDMVAKLLDHPIANSQRQLLALVRTPSEIRDRAVDIIAAGDAKNVPAALKLLEGPRPTETTTTTYSGGLRATDDGRHVGNLQIDGRKLELIVARDLKSFEVRQTRQRLAKKPPELDSRTLTIPLTAAIIVETVAGLPDDLAKDVDLGAPKLDEICSCPRCGGTDFWRDIDFGSRDLSCRACDPPVTPEVPVGGGGTMPFPMWLFSRVDASSPRIWQTIAIRPGDGSSWSDSAPGSWDIDISWWHAQAFLGGESPEAVLVEIRARGAGVGHRFVRIGGPQADCGEKLREAIRELLLRTMTRTHGLTEKRGRYYRRDGSEVVFSAAAKSIAVEASSTTSRRQHPRTSRQRRGREDSSGELLSEQEPPTPASQLRSALTGIGFKSRPVERAIERLGALEGRDLRDLIREALAILQP